MEFTELLKKVKSGLGIAGEFQDDTLTIYIDEVKEFMKDAGVSEAILNSSSSVGCIMKGVNDLMNLAPGASKFSPYFEWRVAQLAIKSENAEGGANV